MARRRKRNDSDDLLKLVAWIFVLLVMTGALPAVLAALGVAVGVGLSIALLGLGISLTVLPQDKLEETVSKLTIANQGSEPTVAPPSGEATAAQP